MVSAFESASSKRARQVCVSWEMISLNLSSHHSSRTAMIFGRKAGRNARVIQSTAISPRAFQWNVFLLLFFCLNISQNSRVQATDCVNSWSHGNGRAVVAGLRESVMATIAKRCVDWQNTAAISELIRWYFLFLILTLRREIENNKNKQHSERDKLCRAVINFNWLWNTRESERLSLRLLFGICILIRPTLIWASAVCMCAARMR